LHRALPESYRVQVSKITGQGLSAIALSVALLWFFVIAERRLTLRTVLRQAQVIEQIRQLRRHVQPQPAGNPGPNRQTSKVALS
jgi:hypothetical protein